MAPPPEYDKEPKAPDKSATTISCEETKALHNLVNDQQTNSDNKSASTPANTEVENNKHVETLDDGQLRALLDEAITYKCPKDREGKSSLFKELLEEVEQDEQACEAAARGACGAAARRVRGAGGGGGARARRALPHSNSLQDLVAALAAEPAPRRHRAPPAPAHPPVSARAIHGGSLPSGVDTSFLLGEEPPRAGYLATVRCVNPPPLAERRVSASDANAGTDLDTYNRRSKPAFPMTYTARATLEIGSGSVSSGRAVTTTTASNQVDSAIPFSCITSPEVVASCNTTSSNAQSAVAVDPKPRSVINVSSLNGLPLSRPNYGSTGSTTQDEFKKSIDENGNSVQGFSSPLSGSSQHKKPRRKKSSKNETVIKSHQIDGYQGNKDLNEVLRFIESNAETTRAHKLGRAKHKDDADDKGGKKRSTERRKDKESKMKRASSLEELSRTTLEDLTDKPPKKERRGDVAPKQERRSWGDDARPAFYYEPEVAADADFQTVTKKRKPRRRADEAERSPGGAAPAPAPARPRRVSAPPSDRSNDSNDDLDSVHSLPADAPPRPAPPAPASYADIARTRHNIPDLIESCNFYAEGEAGRAAEPPPAAPGDSDGYPALEPRAPRARAPPKPQPHAAHAPPRARDRKERLESVRGAECPAPDVVADRRPPVILLDSSSRPRDMDGVTFGFDINEQLLGGPTRRPRCDLVRDAIEGGTVTIVEANGVTPVVTALPGVPGVGVVPAVAGVTVVPGGGGGVCVVAGCALRYVAPAPPPDTHHLHQIVDYVGAAWEDVMRCGGGKLRYFSE
ncbi:nucleolar protein dao-5-like isoform X1 [Pectinophora gossypiella]|nr:nucleolar protein dao-5-like isoform X1 [Pectinophora gossypiella]